MFLQPFSVCFVCHPAASFADIIDGIDDYSDFDLSNSLGVRKFSFINGIFFFACF